MPTQEAGPGDVRHAGLAWRALGVAAVIGAGGLGAVSVSQRAPTAAASASSAVTSEPVDDFPDVEAAPDATRPQREPLELTDAQRGRGLGECATPDPGPGAYADATTLPGGGHIVIPRSGGHDASMGFDVVMHFHGFAPMRKSLVRASTGLVLAGYDWGNGSGAYDSRADSQQALAGLSADVTRALRAHTRDERAHLRHLALSGWSAGYGAISALLRRGDEGIDAVILLDGFHASYLAPQAKGDRVDTTVHAALVAFAARASQGEKEFFFSHSEIKTVGYASTTEVATLLLERLGLKARSVDANDDPLGLRAYVDQKGFHLRSFKGADKRAHCDHLRHATVALRDVIAKAWQTPEP